MRSGSVIATRYETARTHRCNIKLSKDGIRSALSLNADRDHGALVTREEHFKLLG